MTEPVADTAPETAPEAGATDERALSDSARLRGQLRQAEARAERAERALERMERSAKYTVGSLLVEAARSPRRLVLLPRDLWRVWRLRRRARGTPGGAGSTRTRRDDALDTDAARLLVPRASARPDSAFAIVGALSEATAAAWSPYAAVTPALPHEAAETLRALGADLVVIESASALPGESWAFLGDPAAADRQLAALRLIDAAREQGIPVVLLRNTPVASTAFLAPLAARCDLVVDGPGSRRDNPWNPGIDPAAWTTPDAGRPDRAAIFGSDPLTDPRSALGDRALAANLSQALSAAGIRTISPDPRLPLVAARRAALSSAAFGIMSPLRIADGTVGAHPGSLGVLASGRRLVGGPDADIDSLLPRTAWSRVRIEPGTDLPGALAAAQAPLTEEEGRALRREVLLHASAPVCLRDLAQRLGLRGRPAACWDISLVTHDADIDAVLLQTWRPHEVLVSTPLADRARDALHDHGIAVVGVHGARTRDELSLASGSPLVAAPVDPGDKHAPTNLLVERVAGLPTRSRHSDAALWGTS
ncbi:MAG: hypothetical protein ACKOYQ_04255 [Actinomycetota bacterium]